MQTQTLVKGGRLLINTGASRPYHGSMKCWFLVVLALCACSQQTSLPIASRMHPASQTVNQRKHFAWMVKESSETAPILEAAVQPGDYISTLIARAQPDLVTRVGGWSNVYGSANSAQTGATPPRASVEYAVGRCPTGRIQFYDGEHWNLTPESEQDDPAGAILSAASQVHSKIPCGASGFATYSSGTTPDGIFEGWNSCSYNDRSTNAFYNETTSGVSPIGGTTWTNNGAPNSWQSLDYYNTQAQTLLSQTPWDLCYGSISFWWSAISDRMAAARNGNPNIHLWTELSFGNEAWQQIVAAINYSEQEKAHGSISPDVYVVEYPITPTRRPACPDPYSPPTPPPHSATQRCTFAQPSELESFVQAEGRPTPTPAP